MSTNLVAQKSERFKSIIQSDNFRAEVAQALPSHIRPERFQRVLLTSVINDSRLLDVAPVKVVKAALKIAPLGLFTDPLLGEAALVVDGKQEVQVRVMYRGLLKLARQSDRVALAYAHDVCEKDEITVSLGTTKELIHRPSITGRGPVVAYYAVVKYRDGESDFEIMTKDEIDCIRDRSDGWKAFKNQKIKDTPWNSSYDEMAKKTALRRLLKRVPASPDLADALRIEDEADQKEYSGRQPVAAPAQMIEDEPEYVELADQHGEVCMVAPSDVTAWARERAGECISGEELDELANGNMRHPDVAAAVATERENRAAKAEPPPPAYDSDPLKIVKLSAKEAVGVIEMYIGSHSAAEADKICNVYRDRIAKFSPEIKQPLDDLIAEKIGQKFGCDAGQGALV